MSALRTYEVEVVFEVTGNYSLRAETEDEAKTAAVREFREWFV